MYMVKNKSLIRNIKLISQKAVLISTSVILIFTFSACSFLPKEEEVLAPPLKEPEKITYDTVDVKKGSIEKKIRCTGTFVSVDQKDVYFKDEGGILKALHVNAGDNVKQGALIAELDTGNLQDQIQQQDIAVRKAQLNYDKLKAEYDIQGGGDKYNIQQAALDLEAAKLRYSSMLAQLERTRLIAPISGEVVYIADVKEGDHIDAYKSLVRIADPTKLQVQYSDNSDTASKFQLGMKVQVTIDDKNFEGEVVMNPGNAPKDAPESLKNAVRVKVNGLPEKVTIGENAYITLILEKADNVIVLPKNVVNYFAGRKFVYLVQDGLRVDQDVEIGIDTGTDVEIVKGLKEGDKVIVR